MTTKTIHRLAVAGALATLQLAASAQSSVTIYGKVDLGLRRAIGSSSEEIATGSDGRLGFRGTEDLGSGNKAFFQLEHRFFPESGAQDGTQFWKGISVVGLEGSWGRLGLGRQYIPSFSLVQNQVDPFGADTVAGVRDVGMRVGGITKVRVDSAIRYDISFGPVSVAASVADDVRNGGPDHPVSLAVAYRSGPLYLAAGYEDPAGASDEQWNLAASYKVGTPTLSAGMARGKTNAGVTARGYVIGAAIPMGGGQIKAAYGSQRVGGTTTAQKLGLGYHYFLSKRTTLYTDVGHNRKAATDKTGFDLGIIHTF